MDGIAKGLKPKKNQFVLQTKLGKTCPIFPFSHFLYYPIDTTHTLLPFAEVKHFEFIWKGEYVCVLFEKNPESCQRSLDKTRWFGGRPTLDYLQTLLITNYNSGFMCSSVFIYFVARIPHIYFMNVIVECVAQVTLALEIYGPTLLKCKIII